MEGSRIDGNLVTPFYHFEEIHLGEGGCSQVAIYQEDIPCFRSCIFAYSCDVSILSLRAIYLS